MRIIGAIGKQCVLQAASLFSFDVSNVLNEPVALLKQKGRKEPILPSLISLVSASRYRIFFLAPKASYDPYELIIDDGEHHLVVEDIRFGRLFLFAGQSNLSLSLSLAEKREEYTKRSENANVYVLDCSDSSISKEGVVGRPFSPQDELGENVSWEKLNEENCKHFSAIGTMFAILLEASIHSPVGAIFTASGGVSIDAYLPRESIENNEKVLSYLKKTDKYISSPKENKYYPGSYTESAGIFNEKVAPLRGLSLEAIIWNQGENSCFDFASGVYYKAALEVLINSYQSFFKDPSLSFLLIGIADEVYPYGDGYGYLYIQESIINSCGGNVYYVPSFDLDPRWMNSDVSRCYHPIHTIRKEELALRLLDIELSLLKGEKPQLCPRISSYKCIDNYLLVRLDIHNDSLNKGEQYFGFSIAGSDKKYHPAFARAVSDNEILVSSPHVNNPLHVTYAFMHYSFLPNCLTKKGKPLLPYREEEEDISSSLYCLNLPVLEMKFLSLRENNFGYEVGGGELVDLYSKGRITRGGAFSLQLQESGILVNGEGNHDGYGYFGVSVLLSPSGAVCHLDKWKYLAIKLSSNQKGVEFHGALIRKNGRIIKLSLTSGTELMPFISLNKESQEYALSLEHFLDGSQAVYPVNNELSDVYEIELYFRYLGKAEVFMNGMDFLDSFIGNKEENKKEENNPSLRLPGAKE